MPARKADKPKSGRSRVAAARPARPTVAAKAPLATTRTDFPIVGIGASAGGLAAFEAFFSGMPADTDPGMAFVLVQHLAPDHESILTELIRRYTRMQVFEVEDGMVVRPNCAYIIPPNFDMAFLNGALQLLEPAAPRGQRLPIDFFFRSLAQDQRERAIGIVLSGTGSDGTLGVRAIKGEGGMVMAQTPETTEFDGMPRNAIATGLVDYQLAPAAMPARLIAYARHAFGGHLPPDSASARHNESALKKIFILLRAQTSHDFSQYKPSTILRRIERRMAVHQIGRLDGYVKYLQQTPAEVDALFRDMLIGVTSFFRDAEAFLALEEQVIPRLFAGKPANAVIRVWSAGCSTGEEAYSLAILLRERLETLRSGCRVQIFATDIDSRAIATARAGLYPAAIAADITPERLARFFAATPAGEHFRVHKGIRDMLVFSAHDLLKDPPFSRLDLIACRNLLIYLDADLHRKLLPLFHYALNPGGMLFLGTSESTGEAAEMFAALDRRAKLYVRKEGFRTAPRPAISRMPPVADTVLTPAAAAVFARRLPLRDLTEQALLQQVAPAAALVNAQGDILYLHGRTGMYLEPAPGETAVSNILNMAREGLRHPLAAGLRKAAASGEIARAPAVRVKTNGHFTVVNLTIRPLPAGAGAPPEQPLFLVLLEEGPPLASAKQVAGDRAGAVEVAGGHAAAKRGAAGATADARIAALSRELAAKEDFLQAANEELETSNEELKSSNEELQSVNEELQSANEELETSKEELQSVNEELTTVNAELQTKVTDLSKANNDMNNLLAGTGIGTVFVDHALQILSFTPAATRIINLIPGDVGRPVAHTVTNLVHYDRLVADIQAVLDTLIPREVDVQTAAGQWYAMRILPYRTIDNVIEGAVITFVDITEVTRVREALREANDLARLAVVVRDARDAITVQGLDGRILAWNPGATRLYGWSESEALAMHVRERIPPELREPALATLHQLSMAEILQPYRTRRIDKAGAVVEVWITATALMNEAGQMYAIATTERASGMEAEAAAGGEVER